MGEEPVIADSHADAGEYIPNAEDRKLLRTDEAMPEKCDRQNEPHERQPNPEQVDELVLPGDESSSQPDNPVSGAARFNQRTLPSAPLGNQRRPSTAKPSRYASYFSVTG